MRATCVFLLTCLCFVGLAVWGARTIDAAPIDRREIDARKEFASGHYQEALDIFSDLFAQSGDPIHLRNIARCYQRMKRPDEAIANFQDYLSKAKSLSATEHQEIEGYIHEMEALRAEQATPPPPTTPPSARPAESDQVPNALSPNIAGSGAAPTPAVSVPPPGSAGEGAPLGAPAGGRSWRVAGIATAAAGAALLGGGLLFGLAAHSASQAVSKQYDASRDSAGKRDATLQWVGYGVGLAAVASGALLFLHGRATAESSQSGGGMHAWVAPGRLIVEGRF